MITKFRMVLVFQQNQTPATSFGPLYLFIILLFGLLHIFLWIIDYFNHSDIYGCNDDGDDVSLSDVLFLTVPIFYYAFIEFALSKKDHEHLNIPIFPIFTLIFTLVHLINYNNGGDSKWIPGLSYTLARIIIGETDGDLKKYYQVALIAHFILKIIMIRIYSKYMGQVYSPSLRILNIRPENANNLREGGGDL